MQAAAARTIAAEAIDAGTTYLASLSRKKQLALAGKAGAWGEFVGERIYNMAKKKILGKGGKSRKKGKYSHTSRSVVSINSGRRSGIEFSSLYTNTLQPGMFWIHQIGANIPQGVGFGNRIGNKVFVKGVGLRGVISNLNASQYDTGFIRMVCALNHRPVQGTGIDFFAPEGNLNNPVDFGENPNYRRIIQKINPQKLSVLRDDTLQLAAIQNQYLNARMINKYWPINRWITINTNTANVREQTTPVLDLYFFVERNDNANFTTPIILDFQLRTYFLE